MILIDYFKKKFWSNFIEYSGFLIIYTNTYLKWIKSIERGWKYVSSKSFFFVFVAGIPSNCFLSSKLGNFLLIHDDSEQVCYTRYQVLFYLWWIRPVPKHCKVSKHYDQDYRWKISFQKALLTIQVIPQQK